MEALTGIITAFGLSASAGLNAYIPLLVIALLARFTDLVNLQHPWDTLTSPWIIGLLVVLTAIEFFADKVPAINHVNDLLQTFVRPVAGAIVFAASAKVLTEVHPVIALAAGLLVAGSVHTVKAVAVRPAVTATTAGAGNIPVSLAEDAISTITSLLAILVPLILAFITILLSTWLVARIWRRYNPPRTA